MLLSNPVYKLSSSYYVVKDWSYPPRREPIGATMPVLGVAPNVGAVDPNKPVPVFVFPNSEVGLLAVVPNSELPPPIVINKRWKSSIVNI